MKGLFITGTDTNVGKTLVSAILTMGLNANYWKPIQSGIQDEISDGEQIQSLSQLPHSNFFLSTYSLKASLSPHTAAELENIEIDMQACQLPQSSKPLIVEGAGGVYVPINQNHCMLHLMKQLGLPVVVVARGTLGTINHTLMTLHALKAHKIEVKGVIFSGELNPANQTTIEQWAQIKTLFHVPYFDEISHQKINGWVTHNKELIAEAFA
jgi:dethiobiotin synthase